MVDPDVSFGPAFFDVRCTNFYWTRRRATLTPSTRPEDG